MTQLNEALKGIPMRDDICVDPKSSERATMNTPTRNKRLELSQINLNSSSTFEDVVAEAMRLSDSKNNAPTITDRELEKETLYKLAEDGMLNLSRQEIDLLFLKRTYPVRPDLQYIKEDFDINNNDVKMVLAIVFGILGIIASVWLCQPEQYGFTTVAAIILTGLSWFYAFRKMTTT